MIAARAILCILLVAACAAARLQPAPELATPPVIALKAGGSVEIALAGGHLGKLQSVVVMDARGLAAAFVGAPKDDQVRLRITAATDAQPGERRMRLVGPDGVT